MSVSQASRWSERGPHSTPERGGPRGAGNLQADVATFLGQVLHNVGSMAYRRRYDDPFSLVFATPGSLRLTGFEPHDLVDPSTISYAELVHPEDRERVRASLVEAVRHQGSFHVRYRIRRVDGTERLVSDHGYVTRDADGDFVIDGVVIEADEPQEAPTSASQLDEGYQALVEQSLAGIYLIEDGRFVYVNERFAQIFGYEIEEILALPSVLELVYPDDRHLVAENLQHRMEGRATELRYEFRGLTRAGRCVYVEVHGRRIDHEGSPRVLGILLDTSERKRAELGAREAEKLEALARMAGGVSHDLNNFLSTIRSTAEVLQLERADDDQLAEDLHEIVVAVERGTKLSQQLSKFARLGATAEVTGSPSEVLSELTQTLKPLLGRRIELHVEIEPDLPEIPLASADLQHAVMNLVLNAQDAMPEGGVLTIRASSGAPTASGRQPAGHAAHVTVEVTDTGTGIAPEHRDLLFEPYFTTRREDGAGLGLANVWRIVRGGGGTVQVRSTPGEGSTFRLIVPAGRDA